MQNALRSSDSRKAFRRVLTAFAGVVVAAAGLLGGGCASTARETNLMMFAANAPAPTIVERGTELLAAESAAKAQRGCFAVRGEGCSMEPMYVAGTAVVVRAGGYDQLRTGMPVVYASNRGFSVAHMLVAQTEHGWVAAGLNNDASDVELVTRDNLVGVITQAFASRTGAMPKAAAARVALNDQIRRGGKVASAQGRDNSATNDVL